MRDALKSFCFHKKELMHEKEFYFYIAMETLANFYKLVFRGLRDGNIVHLELKFLLNKNQSGWLTTSHKGQLLF